MSEPDPSTIDWEQNLGDKFQREAHPDVKRAVLVDLTDAATAASGGSNDDEIEALWECARTLSRITGIEIPEIE